MSMIAGDYYIPEEDLEDEYLAKKIGRDHDPKMSCRETVLDEAKSCICTDRQNQYGPPENSFNYISELWTVYLQNDRRTADISISPTDVAIMMILLKVARTARHKSYSDNYVDMAGYAALAAELAAEEAIDNLCCE